MDVSLDIYLSILLGWDLPSQPFGELWLNRELSLPFVLSSQ